MERINYLQESWFKDVPIVQKPNYVELLPLHMYDLIIIFVSGGKDSTNIPLILMEMGVSKSKMVLWHQAVDGKPGSPIFADWAVTHSYVKALGAALGIKVETQWRVGGFKGELMKENSMTADVEYEYNGNIIRIPTLKAKVATRRKYPAQSADLRTRYCSSVLKIDVATKVLTNHPEFKKGNVFQPFRILCCSGERAEESFSRSRYLESQFHPANSKSRLVHHWRIVLKDTERKIWDRLEKYRVMPHPAYFLGFGRTSCASCVFNGPDHWHILREVNPEQFYRHVQMEKELNFTIDSKGIPLEKKADMGSLKRLPKDPRIQEWIRLALSDDFKPEDIFVDKWELPAGAFSGNTGGSI